MREPPEWIRTPELDEAYRNAEGAREAAHRRMRTRRLREFLAVVVLTLGMLGTVGLVLALVMLVW